MRIDTPAPETVTVIDYDITLASGKEISFTLRPDLGDTADEGSNHLLMVLARTKHQIVVRLDHVAVIAKHERLLTLPTPKLAPQKASLGLFDTPIGG